jgi:PadR family transcriptional regulator PadR
MKNSSLFVKGVADVVILHTLERDGEAYGYQLIERIQAASVDVFRFQEGTLYPLLYRLENDGFVTSRRKMATNGKERRYYRVTDKGRKQLASRRAEYLSFHRGMDTLLSPAAL